MRKRKISIPGLMLGLVAGLVADSAIHPRTGWLMALALAAAVVAFFRRRPDGAMDATMNVTMNVTRDATAGNSPGPPLPNGGAGGGTSKNKNKEELWHYSSGFQH